LLNAKISKYLGFYLGYLHAHLVNVQNKDPNTGILIVQILNGPVSEQLHSWVYPGRGAAGALVLHPHPHPCL
jgi:hypothetical protein